MRFRLEKIVSAAELSAMGRHSWRVAGFQLVREFKADVWIFNPDTKEMEPYRPKRNGAAP